LKHDAIPWHCESESRLVVRFQEQTDTKALNYTGALQNSHRQ
jgi:hypothetical protein